MRYYIVNAEKNFNIVNKSCLKRDALSLVTGARMFVDDEDFHNMLYAKMLWSPHAHAYILNIDTSKAEKFPGVHAVLTFKNVPRIVHTTAGQGFPEPSPYDTFILDRKVRFVGDRVAAVAAETPEIAEEALKLIEVEYEILKPLFDSLSAQDPDSPVIHDEPESKMILPLKYDKNINLASHTDFEIGDIDKGFTEADFIVENTYEAHYAQHTPMETHICITYLDSYNRLVIRTSTQVPYHVRRIIAQSLDMKIKDIRVIKTRVGGSFGSKQEIVVEDIASLLTLKTGLPVKFEYTRKEEFISSRTRHPQNVKLKTGIKKDGTITALDMKIIMNTGAYGTHCLTVLCNSASKVLPLFNKIQNLKFYGDAVYTNLPIAGAFRGYGATQAYNAFCQQIDILADKIDMDIIEFYKMHHIKEGETSPIFKKMGEGKEGVDMLITSCGLSECIDLGAKEFDWYAKKSSKKIEGSLHYGVGMVCLLQGSSVPEMDMGAAFMKMNEDGSFNLLLGATDIGTGSDTIFAQMAAEILSVDETDIIVYSSDTDFTPFDVGAYASSTTYLSGGAVIKAAEKCKSDILNVAAQLLKTDVSNLFLDNASVICSSNNKKVSFKEIALSCMYETNQHEIAAHSSHITHKSPPPFSAHFVEVAVDIETGVVKVIKYVNATDCGTPINPKLAEGQCEGAILQGIGYALTEEFIFDSKGRLLNPSFNNYKILNALDMPEIKTILVPTYEPSGPFGAKSVSEININGALPAIANAIYDAVGVRLTKGPYSAENVLNALKNRYSEK